MRIARAAWAVILAEITLASTASAQSVTPQRGFAVDRFDPSERGSEWFILDSLDLRGHKRLTAGGVVGAWSYKPLVAYDAAGNERAALIEHQVFVHAGASLVLWNRLRAGVSLPIAVYQTGDAVTIGDRSYAPPSAAFGDLRLSADVRLFGYHRRLITGAAGASLYLPTGSRDNYTSDGTVRFTPHFAIAGDTPCFTYAARIGFAYRSLTDQFQQTPLGSEITASAALGLRLVNAKLVVGPEVFASSVTEQDAFLHRRTTPIEGLLGAHYTVSNFRFGLGAGRGLTKGWGTPTMRAFASAEWTPGYDGDVDHDGIPNEEDACPNVPGPRTDNPKTNGCPVKETPATPARPGADRDGDGIPDDKDACPDVPGVPSRVPSKNGCPSDRDGDGVPDLVDACPDQPGPKSADPARNGCPPDRDGDGILDDVDACPDLPGVPSSDPTANGCPPDRDGDGIYDKEDACPDAPGPADPDPKRNGCPLARIEAGEIKIVEQLRFKNDSAEILRDSDATLVAVAMILKANPAMKVQIEGHTDNRGREAHNGELSYRRARAVEKWLVSFGIDGKRLEAKGFGSSHPIDDNKTEAGRQNNRRVEFHITSTDARR
jgi:outer membrane protein OmpA-like peptidoglycan-associated protein